MAAPHKYEIDMCSGSILPKMLRFSIPLMVSGVLQLLFNAADIVVVGRFAGHNSLAAVGSNSCIINLMVNMFIGLSIGANIIAARYYGAGDREELRKTVHTAMLLGLVLVPLVSLLTRKSCPKGVEEMFACYDEKVVSTAKKSLGD